MFTETLQRALSEYEMNVDLNRFPFTAVYYPVVGIMSYLLIIICFQPSLKQQHQNKLLSKSQKLKKKITPQKWIMFFHNVLLGIFSASCAYNVSPIIVSMFSNHSVLEIICDKKISDLYVNGTESTFGFWVHLFYLSKYYEFLDTFIVIACGKRPIFLQIFHHCGAVVGMWLVVISSSNVAYLWCMLNGSIHTIMYFYYAMSSVGVRIPGKFIITQLQILQFIFGISVGSLHFYYGECMPMTDVVTHWYNLIYVFCVLLLFLDFYRTTYQQKNKKKRN